MENICISNDVYVCYCMIGNYAYVGATAVSCLQGR